MTPRPLGLYFAAWIPLALAYALAVRLTGADNLDALLAGMTTVGSAALLALAARRFMLFGVSRRRALTRHVGLAVAFATVWSGLIALQVRFGAPPDAFDQYVKNAAIWQLMSGLILYTLVATAFTVVETSRKLQQQEALAARADALRVRAELGALRSQLNPHFLFNTLHSITALVRTDAAGAEWALERLGALLRRVLELNRESQDEVALAEELDFVRDYLGLEKMRLGDRLAVVEDIDAEALDCMVLTFTLQPLVENAIRHGAAPLGRRVTIRLSAEVVMDRLQLEVADDGAGSDATSLESRYGVGLSAVQARLRARFGDAATMAITTAPGQGFRVRLDLPVAIPVVTAMPVLATAR
jgi:two-component sensor histidine kinase